MQHHAPQPITPPNLHVSSKTEEKYIMTSWTYRNLIPWPDYDQSKSTEPDVFNFEKFLGIALN